MGSEGAEHDGQGEHRSSEGGPLLHSSI
jgi:hypothetical protein